METQDNSSFSRISRGSRGLLHQQPLCLVGPSACRVVVVLDLEQTSLPRRQTLIANFLLRSKWCLIPSISEGMLLKECPELTYTSTWSGSASALGWANLYSRHVVQGLLSLPPSPPTSPFMKWAVSPESWDLLLSCDLAGLHGLVLLIILVVGLFCP